MKVRNRVVAALAGIGMFATSVVLLPAYAVPNYPTAAEVAAAKASVQKKAEMVQRIEGLLETLQQEADALEIIALQKNEQYNQAVEEVSQMAAKVVGLEAQVESSAQEAEDAKIQLAQIVGKMYRDQASGNTSLELFFNPDNAEDLLYQLTMQDMMAQRTGAIYRAAAVRFGRCRAQLLAPLPGSASLEPRRR